LAELLAVLFPCLAALYLIFNTQLDTYRKRIRFLEVKVDALIKHTGIEFNDSTLVPTEVHLAIKAGDRLKAIRLYRNITGADLKEASEVVDDLVKKTQ
jgi:ribosomal protein L7/L12